MIEGSLKDAPFSDVLQIIASGQKSGVLTVVRAHVRSRIYFERGRIQYAHLHPGIHLGEILVRMELLTTFEVQQTLLEQPTENPGTPLGLMAIHKGFLEETDLKSALRAQVLEVLIELMTWREGTFSFTERSLEASQMPTEHTLDAMFLLMEVANRLESWCEGDVDKDAVFEKSGDPTRLSLESEAWEVLGYVDGRRSALNVAAELDLPERQVYRILSDLHAQEMIRPSPFRVDTPLVLVISKSPALQRLIGLTLQRARLKVRALEGLEGGVGRVLEFRPRALVVDDGEGEAWEFVRELRALPGQGHLPVLILSQTPGPPSGGLFSRFRRPKATLMKKPFHEIELQQTVAGMVGLSLT